MNLLRKFVDTVASPVLVREMQSGMRARRTVVVQSVYLIGLAAVALLVMLAHVSRGQDDAIVMSPEAGRRVMLWIFVLQWVMVVLIAPSFTCSLLSSERERKTYEMLLASLMSAEQIVCGKLLFGVSYVLLLLVSSLPIAATAFFLGGVSPGELTVYYVILFISGLLICQLALFFSSREKKTSTATNQSYGMAFGVLLVGLVSGGGLVLESVYSRGTSDLATALTHTTEYHGLMLPRVLPLLLLLAWLSWGLFVKSSNFVRNGAKYVLWMQRAFIYWSLSTATLCAMLLASTFGQGGRFDTLAFFWSMFSLLALFFVGLFTPRPVLHSKRDRAQYARHLSSRSLFFPIYLAMLALLPAVIFHVEDLSDEMTTRLMETVGLLAFWILCYFVFAASLERLSRGRINFRLAHFILFVSAALSPIIALLQMNTSNDDPSIWSLYFMSPFTVMAGLWSDLPHSVMLNGSPLPLDVTSAAFYGTLAAGTFLLGAIFGRVKDSPRAT